MGLLSKGKIEDFIRKRLLNDNGRYISVEDSEDPDLKVAYAWGNTVNEEIHQLIVYSNNPKFPPRVGIHTGPEEVLDRIEEGIGEKCRSILGYSIDGGIEKSYIRGYQHRGLFVGSELNGRGIGNFLHDSMNIIAGGESKEITYVPSLLLFYMQRGFEIDKIHIITEGEDISPSYELTKIQKEGVMSTICWCLKNGDLSLPFFVELKHTGNNLNPEDFNDMNLPEWIPIIIDKFQASTDMGFRSFFFQDSFVKDRLVGLMKLEPESNS